MTALPEQMVKTLRKYHMLTKGSRVLVAFSGGADSLALLCAFLEVKEEWELELAAAHLDHGLRGDSARDDADWAESFCGQRGIPFFRGYWPGSQEVKKGRSPEEAARNARRRFLEATLARWPGDAIALGHHLDDQAETVLIRLLNGTGLRGLGGMWPVRGSYIRPLIETDRKMILDYVAERGLVPRYDETNEDIAYLRNRLRHRVITELKECNPGFSAAVSRMAELARKEDAYLDRLAEEALDGLAPTGDAWARDMALFKLAGKNPEEESRARLSLTGLVRLDPVLVGRVLRLWIEAVTNRTRIDMSSVERIYELARIGRSGAAVSVGGNCYVRIEQDILVLSGKGTPFEGAPYREIAAIPGYTAEYGVGVRFTTRWADEQTDLPAKEEPFDRYICAWPTEGPWPEIRRRRPGDWLAMPYGRKKLKELLIERGVPFAIRSFLPLLARDSQVLWIPGVARGGDVYRSAHTTTKPDEGQMVEHVEKQLEITCYVS